MRFAKQDAREIMFQVSELKKVEHSSSACSGVVYAPRPSLAAQPDARCVTLSSQLGLGYEAIPSGLGPPGPHESTEQSSAYGRYLRNVGASRRTW
jgi:hypothetical protein